MRHVCRKKVAHRADGALAWCLVLFIALQVALDLAIDRWPQIRDPEFGFKLRRLQARLASAAEGPLVLLVGSSRTAVGVDPRAFHDANRDDCQRPLVFNFAMTGAGPIQQWLVLDKLLKRGIRPSRLLIELHPLFLNQRTGALREETRIDARRLDRSGLGLLCDFSRTPSKLKRRWWMGRLVPWHGYRHALLDAFLPGWCSRPGQYASFSRIAAEGWLPFEVADRGPRARQARIDHGRREYQEALLHFQVTSEPARALQAMLDCCAKQGIVVGIYLMPEASEFRDWYPPQVRREVDGYLNELRQKYVFQLHDFSRSMPNEAFADGHHLLPEAAQRFSRQFARELIAVPADTPVPSSGQLTARRAPARRAPGP